MSTINNARRFRLFVAEIEFRAPQPSPNLALQPKGFGVNKFIILLHRHGVDLFW